MDYVDIQAVESKLTDVTVTPIPMNKSTSGHAHNYSNQQQQQQQQLLYQAKNSAAEQFQAQNLSTGGGGSSIVTPVVNLNQFPNNSSSSTPKYAQLLMILEEMGRDIRPTYSGSRSSAERLKRGIVHARILVRECLLECGNAERSARQ